MNELLIERDGFLRIARVREGDLTALRVIRDTDKPSPGDIYSGIIRNVSMAQHAVFIDLGTGRNAYLHVRSARALEHYRIGDAIAVEVLRGESGKKGAKVTDEISLTDGNLVVMRGRGYTFSRSTDPDAFYAIHGRIPVYPDLRLMIRSGSLALTPDELQRAMDQLTERFRHLIRRSEQSFEPERLYRDLRYLEELAGDPRAGELMMIHSNDPGLNQILRLMGHTQITEYPPGFHVFHRHGIESAVERLRSKTIPLPAGGTLVIEETEALTAIDVNSGSRPGKGKKLSALELNEAALAAALEQIELRNLAGIIVIDFVAMDRAADGLKLYEAAKTLTREMRPLTKAYPLTELGLMQIARRRQGESVTRLLFGRENTRKLPLSPTYLYKLIRIRLDDPAWAMKRFEISFNPAYQLEQNVIAQLLAADYPEFECRLVTRPDVDPVKVVPVLA